jgi:hypothetical protein
MDLGSGQLGRNLQKVSPPRPLFPTLPLRALLKVCLDPNESAPFASNNARITRAGATAGTPHRHRLKHFLSKMFRVLGAFWGLPWAESPPRQGAP